MFFPIQCLLINCHSGERSDSLILSCVHLFAAMLSRRRMRLRGLQKLIVKFHFGGMALSDASIFTHPVHFASY